MHNIKRFLGKRIAMAMVIAALASSSLLGCGSSSNSASSAAATESAQSTDSSTVSYPNAPTGSELSVEFKEKDTNTSWQEASYETIALNGTSISYTGTNATVSDNIITITAAGIYHISGTLSDGQIIIDADKQDFVWLVLDNADITNTKGAAIYAKQSDKVTITLADDSKNSVTDGSSYDYGDETEIPTACIFSKDDLSINGSGLLSVTSNSADGISTTNDLKIVSGTITVKAADDGLRGKDSVAIKDGVLSINAKGDGIKSTNKTEDCCGYLYIEGGTFTITSGNDAIQAEKSLCIKGGDFTITTNEGSSNAPAKVDEIPGKGGNGGSGAFSKDSDMTVAATPSATEGTESETASTSCKALKSGHDLYITGGSFVIDSYDDAVHSDNTATIENGTFTIAAGDDGVHADNLLTVNDGTITVTSCYEGVESTNIVINNGTIDITSKDDAINAGGGTDSSAESSPMGGDPSHSSGNCTFTINGGTITVTADGDGLDANGSIYQNGGTIVVNGPTNGGNGSLDYDNTYVLSGGSLLTVGTSGMTQTPSSDSTQASIYVKYTSQMAEGTEIRLCDASGNTLFSHTAVRAYDEVLFSSGDILQNETYTLYNGTEKLCTITPSSSVTCVTDSGEETTVSSMGGGMHGGNRGDAPSKGNGTPPSGKPDKDFQDNQTPPSGNPGEDFQDSKGAPSENSAS